MTTTEEQDITAELLPCPFCGGTKLNLSGQHPRFSIVCFGCLGEMSSTVCPKVIEKWNTRATVKPSEPVAGMKSEYVWADEIRTYMENAVQDNRSLPDLVRAIQADAIAAHEKPGWVLVPVEATQEMIERVNSNCDVPDADLSWTWDHWLAAAPKPEKLK